MSEEHPVVGNSSADPLLGSVLADRYRIERKLGEGGMGAVYLAKHVILEKIVALKILHDEYARRRELVERFLHEAKAASRIRHEHVIDITDFGETATKNVFFAMEYLDGHDLATELDRGQLSWPRAKSVILQICAALQAAHEAGVIHRDLKPENIYLIERLGNPDYVKVLDFGVAKLTEMEDGKERRLTRTGMVFGTPEYMSPEQARGEKPDMRVDVYATGCILFEMVTGDVPYRADNFMGVLTKHLFDPLPLASERCQRTDLPPGIQEVISQALSKDKNQRFGSMNELAVAIDTLDNVEGVVAYSTAGTIERSRRHALERSKSDAPGRAGTDRDKAEAARRAVARAATTPAPTEDDLTIRQPLIDLDDAGHSAADDERTIRRRGRWGVLGAALALALAAGGVIAWQLGVGQGMGPKDTPASPSPAPSEKVAPPTMSAPTPPAAPVDDPPVPAPAVAPAVAPEPVKAADVPPAAPEILPTEEPPRRPDVDPQKTAEPAAPAPIKPTADTAKKDRGKRPDRRHTPASVHPTAPAAPSPAPEYGQAAASEPTPAPAPHPPEPAPKTDLKDPFGGK